jgi:UDP-GlcNAc:undecaprenyl-phosphate GlcNAc-1-phosphate transferase
VINTNYQIGIVIVGGLLVVAGALDDLYQYSAKIQLLILLAAGVVVQFFASSQGQIQIKSFGNPLSPSHPIILGSLAMLVTAIYIFIVTKTMDTIDGVDGLAAGIATISAATLTIIGVYGEQPRVAIIAAAIAGAALGFLRHNYNPAKIIMGTGGAYILGFMLACLSIVGAFKTAAAIALIIPLCVFGVPLFDAAQVVIRRKLSGVPITQADKRHVHHTLLNKGLSQRQTVLVLYLAAALLCFALIVVVRSYA